MMSNKLIDSHFVSQSQVCILQTLVVAQDRGGFRGIYRQILIDEFFQSCKTVWTVRSTDIFHVSFILAEFLRLVMIGADEPVGFFSFKEYCLLWGFFNDSGFAIFGRTYQDGFGDECLPFLCDGKSLINRGRILQDFSGQNGNRSGGTCWNSRLGGIDRDGQPRFVHAG